MASPNLIWKYCKSETRLKQSHQVVGHKLLAACNSLREVDVNFKKRMMHRVLPLGV